MSETISGSGQCLCGAVRFETDAKVHMGACHCGMCRRWGGGPFLAVECGADSRFEGDEHIGVFESSDWAERGFCKRCGTHLFYRLRQDGACFMPLGLFPDPEAFVFDEQIFIDRKPKLYSFAEKTRMLTEAEVMAQYAPPKC